jgi:hypothetical protein
MAGTGHAAHAGAMTSEINTRPAPTAAPVPARSTGGLFLEALARRDFEALAGCLAPDVRFRALLPPRDVDVTGPEAMLAEFRRWFGDESENLELVDSTVDEIGPRLYLRWRIRMSPADNSAPPRLVEQHAYANAGDRIQTLNLLCSGFVPG